MQERDSEAVDNCRWCATISLRYEMPVLPIAFPSLIVGEVLG
jgi:hypothetical protein